MGREAMAKHMRMQIGDASNAPQCDAPPDARHARAPRVFRKPTAGEPLPFHGNSARNRRMRTLSAPSRPFPEIGTKRSREPLPSTRTTRRRNQCSPYRGSRVRLHANRSHTISRASPCRAALGGLAERLVEQCIDLGNGKRIGANDRAFGAEKSILPGSLHQPHLKVRGEALHRQTRREIVDADTPDISTRSDQRRRYRMGTRRMALLTQAAARRNACR